MNPISDLRGEHTAMKMILEAMKKLALDMHKGEFIDSYRIVQILDFLHTFTEDCHYEKEEKSLYPSLLECDIPWTLDTINQLIEEHKLARIYINDIDNLFEEYLSGNVQIIDSLSLRMIKYVELEERHIKIVDNVILPLCERLFDAKKLKSIASDLKKIQDHNVGSLKHLEYYKLLAMLHTENDLISENANY
jgi:hemerythrin-like domain-containing protein